MINQFRYKERRQSDEVNFPVSQIHQLLRRGMQYYIPTWEMKVIQTIPNNF